MRVHLAVVVGEGAGAREELLAVGLVREVEKTEDKPIGTNLTKKGFGDQLFRNLCNPFASTLL